MTRFQVVDPSGASREAAALAELLVHHGAVRAQGAEADLIVVAASSVAEARERLGALAERERARALIVGLDETLDMRQRLGPDGLAALLDQLQPLGVVHGPDPARRAFGFTGKRSLADAMGTAIGMPATSREYGGYMLLRGQDAGAFVLRYLRAAARDAAAQPSDAYVAYLRTRDRRASAQAVEDMLVAVDRPDEAVLWHAWCAGATSGTLGNGAWRDREVYLSVSPPRTAGPGELWFDVCELSLMVHAGRAWLATRPTAVWQVRGFLEVAERLPREVQLRPPYTALDPARLVNGADANAVSDLTAGEATLYAWWFGKTVPHLFDWQSAAEQLPPEQLQALWGGSTKEWTSSKLADDEAARVFVTPTTIHEDPGELADDEAAAKTMIAGEYTHAAFLGFRTSVLVQSGLLGTVSSWHVLAEDVRLASLLDRRAFG